MGLYAGMRFRTKLRPSLDYPLPWGFLPARLVCGLPGQPVGGDCLKIYFLERGRGKGGGDSLKLTLS